MRIYCQNCGQHFDIPEAKVPDTDHVKFTCPKCGEKNRIALRELRSADSEEDVPRTEEFKSNSYEQLEIERFPLGSSTALLFGYQSNWQENCQRYLHDKGYYTIILNDVHEAWKKLRVHTHQVIILEDVPETEKLLQEIEKWPGSTRRKVNCLLIGPEDYSLNSIYVFQKGVNGYLSYNVQPLEELLEQALSEYSFFYEPWQQAQEEDNT